jgi:UPF0755 protein
MKRLLTVFGILVILAAAAAVGWSAVRSLDEPLAVAAPVRYRVLPGSSFARVASDLGQQHLLAHPRVWALYARWAGLAAAIKAGEYEIEPGLTPRGLLTKMVNGQVVLYSFTIVDGWRVADLLAAIRRSPELLVTPSMTPADLMERIGAPGRSSEGQFLPETYRFPGGTPDIEILKLAHAALLRELDTAWREREPGLPLHDADELLILASIVEKETALASEQGKIAGLYLHRLSIGMRLQADPTVIYGLGDAYDGSLHTVDLRTDGPYNTYLRTGLPPTPIALPGAAAIRATAHPEKTDALYFVASGRGDGSHVFSATLEEHNVAVASYLARQRQRNAGATP